MPRPESASAISARTTASSFYHGYAVVGETQQIADRAVADAKLANLCRQQARYSADMRQLGSLGVSSGWADIGAIAKLAGDANPLSATAPRQAGLHHPADRQLRGPDRQVLRHVRHCGPGQPAGPGRAPASTAIAAGLATDPAADRPQLAQLSRTCWASTSRRRSTRTTQFHGHESVRPDRRVAAAVRDPVAGRPEDAGRYRGDRRGVGRRPDRWFAEVRGAVAYRRSCRGPGVGPRPAGVRAAGRAGLPVPVPGQLERPDLRQRPGLPGRGRREPAARSCPAWRPSGSPSGPGRRAVHRLRQPGRDRGRACATGGASQDDLQAISAFSAAGLTVRISGNTADLHVRLLAH